MRSVRSSSGRPGCTSPGPAASRPSRCRHRPVQRSAFPTCLRRRCGVRRPGRMPVHRTALSTAQSVAPYAELMPGVTDPACPPMPQASTAFPGTTTHSPDRPRTRARPSRGSDRPAVMWRIGARDTRCSSVGCTRPRNDDHLWGAGAVPDRDQADRPGAKVHWSVSGLSELPVHACRLR